MWLLNAETRRLESFLDDRTVINQYAILSHTWGAEEVIFDDIEKEEARSKLGYVKIEYACRQTLQADLQYVWIDTCCIDKRSSAELSEAINSMYRWYYNAAVCFAYLHDVEMSLSDELVSLAVLKETWWQGRAHFLEGLGRLNKARMHKMTGEEILSDLEYFDALNTHLKERLKDARWFSRGWTLQELIAPVSVELYDSTWDKLGTKHDLADILSQLTGVDVELLWNRDRLKSISVAKRMSWASKRKTTRQEDEAYCLLGIFDVNLPLLYGEGPKAFSRLQQEIIRSWSWPDHSILVHSALGPQLLASSSADFAGCSSIVSWRLPHRQTFDLFNDVVRLDIGRTAHGMALTTLLKGHLYGRLSIPLNCSTAKGKGQQYVMPLLESRLVNYDSISDTKDGLIWIRGGPPTLYPRQKMNDPVRPVILNIARSGFSGGEWISDRVRISPASLAPYASTRRSTVFDVSNHTLTLHGVWTPDYNKKEMGLPKEVQNRVENKPSYSQASVCFQAPRAHMHSQDYFLLRIEVHNDMEDAQEIPGLHLIFPSVENTSVHAYYIIGDDLSMFLKGRATQAVPFDTQVSDGLHISSERRVRNGSRYVFKKGKVDVISVVTRIALEENKNIWEIEVQDLCGFAELDDVGVRAVDEPLEKH